MADETTVDAVDAVDEVETDEKDEEKDPELAKAKAEAKEANSKREGIGARLFVGRTRGANSQVITYEQFDKSQPATLPTDTDYFVETLKMDDAALLSILIDGWNAQQYKAASDPIAQFINPEWDDDVVKSFRLVVRNYSVNAQVSIADSVALIRPGIEAAHLKAKAAKDSQAAPAV